MSSKAALLSAGARPIPFLVTLALGAGLWVIPSPEGIEPNAWHLLAIFIATIVGIILKALPMGGMALLAMTFLSATHTLTLKQTLSGFSNPVIWLVVFAFFISKSLIKTGLGIRIAYHFVALLGKKSLGLGYGVAMTELALAPAIPSNTARGGGIVFPIIKSLALAFESTPENQTQRKIGAYLIQTLYHSNLITSAMFLTAMAANPLMVDIANDLGVTLSWGQWAVAGSVPGILSLLGLPWLLYKVYPPEIKETPEATSFAKKHLDEMGKVTPHEWMTLGVFVFMLLLWIFGSAIGIDSTTAAMCGVAFLLILGVLTWRDITEEKGAWDTMFWFASLIMMATYLNQLGVIGWISQTIQGKVHSVPWEYAFAVLVLAFFYSGYVFASITAHVSSMFAAFAVVGITVGVPPFLIIFSLAACSSLCACITHYGTGTSPLLFGAGYVDLKSWWKIGAIVSVYHMIVWIGIGSLWWKFLGLW